MKKILEYIKEHHMIERGDRIVLGVSGGADSVYLLLFLSAIKSEWNLSLQVVHMNHMIRKEAKEEAHFVEALCDRLKVPFVYREVDVLSFAQKEKLSVEEAGRKARYQLFREVLEKTDSDKIAVAHHKNDQAETFLFRMARGTGIFGASAMKAVDGVVIRPLLCLSKEEITKQLRQQNQTWMEDQSNQDETYARNKIRHQVIPALEMVNAGAVDHIFSYTEDMEQWRVYLESVLDAAWKRCISYENHRYVGHVESILSEPQPIQSQLLKRLIETCAKQRKDISKIHVQMLLSLMQKGGTKRLSLPYGVEVLMEYDNLYLFQGENTRHIHALGRIELKKSWLGEIPLERDCIINLDYDKIETDLVLRTWEEGDFFVFNQEGKKKYLQRYFIDAKIPKEERHCLPVVADGKHIVWIVGRRQSEFYKVTEDTKRPAVLVYKQEDFISL